MSKFAYQEPSVTRGKLSYCAAVVLRVLGSAPMAYALLILLQICALRGIWTMRDISSGDTRSYFAMAIRWHESYQVNIAWSPLYTAFFGTIYGLTGEPVQAVLLHRLVLVFASSLLTLAVLRRLLPPGWAWLAAAWWTVLPINFNTRYEVHLFAVLPLLTMWLLQSLKNQWAQGTALAVLGASVILVRNEMCIAFALLASYRLIREAFTWYRSNPRGAKQLLRTAAAYGVPLSLAAALCCFAYSRSIFKFPELRSALRLKHTLNMSQVYSFGYQQRHPEWTKSPWVEYQELMTDHFGNELPSFKQMIVHNPAAVAEHCAWNLGLTWNGVQLLLFNATTGSVNPDYGPVKLKRTWVWIPSILMLTCWAVGSCLLLRHRRFWWRAWFQRRGALWLGMLAVAAVMPLVICTQRPRPSYLFGLSVMLMAWTGMCAFAIAHHLRIPNSWLRFAPLSALLAILVVTALPPHFSHRDPHRQPRPLAARLEQLGEFQALYRDKSTKILQGEYAVEIRAFLGQGKCESHAYHVLRDNWPVSMPLEEFLRQQKFTALYLDENTLTWLQLERSADAQQFLNEQPPAGWRVVGLSDEVGKRWRLYDFQPSATQESAVATNSDVLSRRR